MSLNVSVCYIHGDTHPMTKSHHCFLYPLGLEELNDWTSYASWADRSSSLLWQCLFFGAVRICRERERTKFIYLNSTFPYLALGALASSQVIQGFQLPTAHLGASKSGGSWDMLGRERMRTREYIEISDF